MFYTSDHFLLLKKIDSFLREIKIKTTQDSILHLLDRQKERSLTIPSDDKDIEQ